MCSLQPQKRGKKISVRKKENNNGKDSLFSILADSHSRLWGMNGLREQRSVGAVAQGGRQDKSKELMYRGKALVVTDSHIHWVPR